MNIVRQLQSSDTTKRKLEVYVLKSDYRGRAGLCVPETQFI